MLFLSDNGPFIERADEGGCAGSAPARDGKLHPLRGAKQENWEGGIRVPAVAWMPGTVPAGAVVAAAVAIGGRRTPHRLSARLCRDELNTVFVM